MSVRVTRFLEYVYPNHDEAYSHMARWAVPAIGEKSFRAGFNIRSAILFPTPDQAEPFTPHGVGTPITLQDQARIAAVERDWSAVRGDLFKPSGKWMYEVKLDYQNGTVVEGLNGSGSYIDPVDAALNALQRATRNGTSLVTIESLREYWTLVVPEPPCGYPVMARGAL